VQRQGARVELVLARHPRAPNQAYAVERVIACWTNKTLAHAFTTWFEANEQYRHYIDRIALSNISATGS
jgi:hypothetical protein